MKQLERNQVTMNDALRGRRRMLGWTIAELARQSGLTAANISRYEHGWMTPNPRTTKRLVAALGATPAGLGLPDVPDVFSGPTPLRHAREATGLTMCALAHKAGVAYATLCRWERGWQTPAMKSIKKLADALGVEPEVLT